MLALAEVICVSASHATARGRVGRSGDLVAVELEIGDQSSRTFNREAVGRAGRHHVSVLGPVDKGVSRVGVGRQGHLFAEVVCVSASHATACGRVGRSGDFVAVEAEVGDECPGPVHGEAVVR